MRIAASLFSIAAFCLTAAADTPPSRPMEEMHGGCDNYNWDVSAELALFAGPATQMSAGATEPDAPIVPTQTHLALALTPQANVQLPLPPGSDRGGPDKFAGLFSVEIATPGRYRIVAANGAWVDLVRDGKVLAAASFEMQTKCEGVFKVVAYDIAEGGRYLIQLNGSKTAAIGIAVTAAP